MSDFDDLRGLTGDEDEFDDFSFDDIVDDDDFAYGQEIDEPGSNEPAEPGPINKLLGSMTAQQRLIISAMLFGNVLVLSIGILMVTGRIG